MNATNEPTTRAEIDATLRAAGYDPATVETHFRTIAARAIVQAGGIAYRVECVRRTLATRHHLSEWHTNLAHALEAMLDHQQRPWSSVALVPQVRQVRPQEQLSFVLEEGAAQ